MAPPDEAGVRAGPVFIPDAEISFRFSRSGGPGGQHVNKTATKATLRFDLESSSALTDGQKARLRSRLASRIGADGILQVTCETGRSQRANRLEAIERFAVLLASALAPRRRRRPTGVPRKERRHRLQAKRRRGETKRGRRQPPAAD